MTLRARLTATFTLAVLVPLAVVAVLLGRAVPGELDGRARQQLGTSAHAVAQLLTASCGQAQLAAADLAEGRGAGAAALVRSGGVALAPGGSVAGSLPGVAPADLAPLLRGAVDCAQGSTVGTAGTVGTSPLGPVLVGRRTGALGAAAVATPFAGDLLARLVAAAQSPGHAAPGVTVLTADGTVLATSQTPADGAAVASRVATLTAGSERRIGGRDVVTAAVPGGLLVAVSLRPGASGLLFAGLGLLVVVATLGAAMLGRRLAGVLARPLVQLGESASRIAAGELDAPIEVPGGRRDEVGTLAVAVGDMTDELRRTIRSLQGSRDELRRNLSRLGETLAGTHDLDTILGVVLETAMATVGATGGALLLTSAAGNDLTVTVGEGLAERSNGGPAAGWRVPVGAGVVGGVFSSGEAVRGSTRGGRPGEPVLRLHPAEPGCTTVLAAPLCAAARVTGVLALYDRAGGAPFTEADLDTIRTFATSAGVAVDNVLLHEEAQRLSITDGLTGLWNYRYLTTALSREVERATRFGRPLAVLMLDLDRFKAVNDRHGHQRGDAVLTEVAARVSAVIREVDVLARYGGEELVLVLPETDAAGARELAERVAQAVRGRPFGEAGETPVAVTVSIGIAVHAWHGEGAAGLIRSADEALYAAKRAGRDCWRMAPGAGGARGGADGPGLVGLPAGATAPARTVSLLLDTPVRAEAAR